MNKLSERNQRRTHRKDHQVKQIEFAYNSEHDAILNRINRRSTKKSAFEGLSLTARGKVLGTAALLTTVLLLPIISERGDAASNESRNRRGTPNVPAQQQLFDEKISPNSRASELARDIKAGKNVVRMEVDDSSDVPWNMASRTAKAAGIKGESIAPLVDVYTEQIQSDGVANVGDKYTPVDNYMVPADLADRMLEIENESQK